MNKQGMPLRQVPVMESNKNQHLFDSSNKRNSSPLSRSRQSRGEMNGNEMNEIRVKLEEYAGVEDDGENSKVQLIHNLSEDLEAKQSDLAKLKELL
jgi:hypothetical protein